MNNLVSVIIPVYNTENFLCKCLDSVVNQTYESFEVIIINDGSTDSSARICDEYAKKYDKIKVFHRENAGLVSARDEGIKRSTGEYIAFLDSDDWLEPNFIESLVGLIQLENDIDIVATGCCEEYTDGSKNCFQNIEPGIYSGSLLPTLFEKMLCCDTPFKFGIQPYLWNKLYRRNVLLKTCDTIDPSIYDGEDVARFFTMMLHINKIVITNDVLYHYRIHSNSMCRNKKEDFFSNISKLYIHLYNHFIESKHFSVLLPQLDSYYKKMLLQKDSEALGLEVLDNCSFLFPNYLFKEKSRIVLFGAGHVGMSYYVAIKNTSNMDIVLWVDNNYKHLQNKGIPVENPEMCKKVDFDYILIAIKNGVVANEVKSLLYTYGIPSNKIIWSGAHYTTDYVHRDYLKEKYQTFSNLATSQIDEPRLFLLHTPEYGNIGDHAICLGEKSFISKYFPEYTIIEVTQDEWDLEILDFKKLIREKDILLIQGGGNLGDLWPGYCERMKSLVKEYPDNKIVFLPNTLTYKNEETVRSDAIFYRNYKNVFFCAREKNSYDALIKYEYQKNCNIGLYPDMALFLDKSKKTTRNDQVLVVLRHDREKILDDIFSKKIVDILLSCDQNYIISDTIVDSDIHSYNRTEFLEKKLDEFRESKLVITDRLHGMIFSFITKTPCIAFDNSTHKVSNVYQTWLSDCPYIKMPSSYNDISELIKSLDNVTTDSYNFNYEPFEELAEKLRSIF